MGLWLERGGRRGAVTQALDILDRGDPASIVFAAGELSALGLDGLASIRARTAMRLVAGFARLLVSDD